MAETADAWVQRVLKVTLAAAPGSAPGSAPSGGALVVWQTAKDAVDAQLNQLYGVLRETGLPVFGEVADEIGAVLEKYRVGLVTVLMNYDRASGADRAKARAMALKVVTACRGALPQDKHVVAADTNPFAVPVTIRTTLGGALNALQQQLSAA